VLALSYSQPESNRFLDQYPTRQWLDDPDLRAVTAVVDKRLLERSAVHTALHQRTDRVPGDLLGHRLLPGAGHHPVLQQSSRGSPWAYHIQLLVLAVFTDLPFDIVQLSDGHEQRIYAIHDHPLKVNGYPPVKTEESCVRCPVAEEISCAGFLVPRFCELIDPSCPQYDPGYLQVIVRESRPLRPSDDPSPASESDVKSAAPNLPPSNRHAPVDCCGGGMAPGVYDR
jgi:hypothetical protein